MMAKAWRLLLALTFCAPLLLPSGASAAHAEQDGGEPFYLASEDEDEEEDPWEEEDEEEDEDGPPPSKSDGDESGLDQAKPEGVDATERPAESAVEQESDSPPPVKHTRTRSLVVPSLEIDIMGGYYFFVGNLENLRNGPILGGRVGANILPFLGIEATIGYVPTSTVHGSRQAHYLLSHFDLVIQAASLPVIPYFAVGAGFRYMQIDAAYKQGVEQLALGRRDPYLTDAELADCPADSSCHLRYESRDTDFVFDVGGGVKFLIFDRVGIRLDARYVFSVGPGGSEDGVPAWDNSQAVVWNDQFHHAELTGSVFFLLGGNTGSTGGDSPKTGSRGSAADLDTARIGAEL